MKFIVDAQLPPSLAGAVREIGCDAVAVRDVGLRHAKDSVIWEYALEHHAAIITKDEDFAERCVVSQAAPVVVWLRIGNATNSVLLGWLLPKWPLVQACLQRGDRFVEVR